MDGIAVETAVVSRRARTLTTDMDIMIVYSHEMHIGIQYVMQKLANLPRNAILPMVVYSHEWHSWLV